MVGLLAGMAYLDYMDYTDKDVGIYIIDIVNMARPTKISCLIMILLILLYALDSSRELDLAKHILVAILLSIRRSLECYVFMTASADNLICLGGRTGPGMLIMPSGMFPRFPIAVYSEVNVDDVDDCRNNGPILCVSLREAVNQRSRIGNKIASLFLPSA